MKALATLAILAALLAGGPQPPATLRCRPGTYPTWRYIPGPAGRQIVAWACWPGDYSRLPH